MTTSVLDLAAQADPLSRLRILSDWVVLQHEGVSYANYRIETSGELYIWKGGRWQPKTPHPRCKYLGYNVTNPLTGDTEWIPAHAATEESFRGGWKPGLQACHARGRAKTDIALGSCTGFYPPKVNRRHRRRDGTHRTFGTRPGKLKAEEVQQLISEWSWDPNASKWARRFDCKPQNIRYHLKRRGVWTRSR